VSPRSPRKTALLQTSTTTAAPSTRSGA
jgi:hypothetical protein